MTDEGRAASGEAGSFVGRERDLRELRELARGRRAVTLCGPAGIGKTRLLRKLTSVLAAGYPDGAFFVGLSDLRQPDLVASRIAAAVGVAQEPGVPVLDALTDALRGRRLLLALDHCDHLADTCARLGERLLASSPGLLLITTSRAARPIAADLTWPVPPLAVPPAGAADDAGAAGALAAAADRIGAAAAGGAADRIGAAAAAGAAGLHGAAGVAGVAELTWAADGDAVRLFAERAAAAEPNFAVTSGNCAEVAGICRMLDGLPLAIEVAAARVRDLAVSQVTDGLSERLRVLADGEETAPPARLALRAALDWSYDLLAPPEQVLLRRLSVFAGWSVEIAERVCADGGLPAPRISSLLARLADLALIEVEPDHLGQTRYRMPDAVREYAADRLAASGEAPALRRRLRDYALSLCDYYLAIGLAQVPALWPARVEAFQHYRADGGNIRAALGWCLQQGDIEAGLRLCTGFGPCWLVLGEYAEAARWFGAFLTADQSGVPAAARGPALSGGAFLILGDDPERAERWAAEGLEACRVAGNLLFASAALNLLCLADLRAHRPLEALRHGTEALAQARQCGDQWSEALALGGCASAQAALGRLPEARAAAEAATALMLAIDHQWGAARAMLDLARFCHAAGDLAAARTHFLGALDLLTQVKSTAEIAHCLAGLGRVTLEQGDLAAARSYLAQGLNLSLRAGRRPRISRSLLAMAALEVREHRPDRAVQLAAAATALRDPAPQTAAAPSTRSEVGQTSASQVVDLESLPRRVQRYLDAAAGLGPAEVARLWANGLTLTADAAADLALAPPGGETS